MEALLLQDGAYVNDRYEQLQEERRQLDQNQTGKSTDDCVAVTASELSEEERHQLEQWRIVQRAKALNAKGPTSQLNKKFLVLQDILEKLYTPNEADLCITSPSNGPLKRVETGDANSPVPFKELPIPTQVVLKMFFRTCQSLRDPTKLVANSRLSVQIANKLPTILTTMPSCVLSPGLVDDAPVELEDGGNVWSVFYQLFQLFEELLGLNSENSSSTERVCLSANDRATVIVAYVALSLKWGRLGYLLKGVRLLLENTNEVDRTRFEPLLPLFHELAATSVERPQVAFGEEEQPCGYLMSFGKGDHGKLGHGQCVHVSCQEGNCTENKMSPTMIAATRDILFRKIDSLSTHSIAITAKGEAMAWGNGDKYRLGHGSSTKEYTPRTIEFLSLKGRVRDLACGLGHTMALMESGELFAWGNGSNGRLGLGDTNDRSSPTKVVVPTTSQGKEAEGGSESNTTSVQVRFRHIFCGASHSLGISWDGRAYAWGKNNQGQCGHGHTNDQWTIQEVESFRDNEDGEEEECITYAAGGWEHTLFCTGSGRVYSCGCGYKDSRRAGIPPVLGHGDCDRRLKPTLVQTLDEAREEIIKVACGWDHSLAVSASGKVYTWGSGTNGKLGHGDEESFDIPVLVRSMEGKQVKDAKAGCEHTVFLTHDHELWTCGQGDSGRLGHGDNQTRKRPTKIEVFAELGLKPVALAVGDKYNLILVKGSDGQYEHEGESISTQKTVEKNVGVHVSNHGTTGVHHGRHRKEQHKTRHNIQENGFEANWILSIAAGIDPQGSPASKSATTLNPDSAISVALFIVGHVDRLASDYISDESTHDKYKEPKGMEMQSKAQKSVVLPFTTDTSYESLQALVLLLQLIMSRTSSKEKTIRSEKSVSDSLSGLCLGIRERMGLSLSCLRILQLNLKKSLGVFRSPAQIFGDTSSGLIDLFGHIHELLDDLASRKGEDTVFRFDNEIRRSAGTQLLSLGGAISHEAAYALKMGFGIFYPTDSSRCRLLWEILDDCKADTPSMRTVILSNQLCKDSIMTEIFRSLPTHGLLNLQKELSGDVQNESITRKDVSAIKTLMMVLLKRSSAEAIKHLDNEAFADFTSEPDCFLRLLHVLQMHYFSIAHRSATREGNMNEKCNSMDPMEGRDEIMDSLLEYVDALMTESLAVLKTLHKGSRQHEEIITWRLNGSFFHTLLPSAIECLSVVLLPVSNRKKPSKSSVTRTTDNLLLVQRILPNLHVMLKMLDEVSWKMHTVNDPGNQAHDDSTFPHHTGFTAQERNWFVDLGDACAVLCGKLSCELFYPSKFIAVDDITHHGMYYSLVLSEGRLLREDHDTTAAKAQMAKPISTILNWECMGVFEVEDELVGCKDDVNTSMAIVTSESQRFLLQFSEADYSVKPLSFWRWIAAKFSDVVEFTIETERLLTIVLSVSSWHLGLSEETRHVYELYDDESQKGSAIDTVAKSGGIWRMLYTLLNATKRESWIYNSINMEVVANAIKLARLLLNLQPNPALVPPIFRPEQEMQHTEPFWQRTDDSLVDMLDYLTKSVDVDTIQQSLLMKEVHGALLRTGICILHDLLRKLTTSSTKSCLLDEFVAVTCGTHRVSSIPVVSMQSIMSRENGNGINKAIENLFVRLARIVSSEDASFDLKKKALMAWTVPLSTTKRDVPCVVALIAKSGIMSTLVELLLDEANVLDAHSGLNASTQPMTPGNQDDKWCSISQFEWRQAKVSPIIALLFDQTPAQVISVLAWEAFSAIAMQLSKSEHFADHRPNLLLRSAGSSVHEREPLTPRSTSMSPRRRLTLPKKMVISSIDEIIEQMTDGLFLMLKGVKSRLDSLDASSKEYSMLLQPEEEINESTVRSAQQNQNYSQVFLFGHPVQISHSSTHDIRIHKLKDTDNSTGNATSLSLSFWMYVEHTCAMVRKTILNEDGASSTAKESSVRLLVFSTDHDTSAISESTDAPRDGSMIVFTRDSYPDYVSLGLSVRCGEGTDGNWCSIVVDEHLPRGKWVQVVLSFDKERPEPLQVFVGARRSTLNNGLQSADHCKKFCLKFLQHANSWTQLRTGGNVDVDALTNGVSDTNTESMRLSILQKKSTHGFTAVLDDIIIGRVVLTEEMVSRMQINGPVLFRLKQQHIAENHCVKVLRLLWQLIGAREESSGEVPLGRLSPSDRWIMLFIRMLLNTTCTRDQALAQVHLCNLLADVLPRAPPLPEFNVQSLGQKLFTTPRMKSSTMEELFATFNEQSHLSSTSATRRHNEALYRTMQQHGMLHWNYRGGNLSDNDEMMALKRKTSIRFAAAVHLFQTILSSPSWRSRMDQFVGQSSAIFQGAGGWKEIIHSKENSTLQLADMTAVVSAFAGYSEEVVNAHRAAVQDATILPSPTEAWCSPLDSVIHFDDSNAIQTAKVQDLVGIMLKEETRQALCLPPRKDILATCHNDVVTANAVDVRIVTVAHQRARVLRAMMTAQLREKSGATSNSWHDFVLENTRVCNDLLQVASANMKEYVTTVLGADAKTAMKLRRLRIFIKEVLRGGKHSRGVPLAASLSDLESLQWRLWEEMATQPASAELIPWWQQSSKLNGKITLEIVGGEVELCDLKVKALEHFPTVKLAQANICVNSGLWFFEVVVLTDGLMQIGYVDGDFTADPLQGQGVGDHTNSWAFDGFRCKKWNGNSYEYGEQWKADDVVGVLLDTYRMEISYFLNGKFLGVAFSGISITASSRMCPAASLNVHQSAEFNFGTPSITFSNEDGVQTSGVDGFKHMPILDNEDQTRLRPIITALHTRRTSKTNGTPNVGTSEKEEAKETDASEEWSSTSSSDSDTDDGEIALEGSESLSGLRRNLELGSRDGRETSTIDQNEEEIDQRRRDLVEGLTGLGFPLEWATRCASEARLPMDETGAVAWILEQMEKVGLDGASRIPTNPMSNDDGGELPPQPTALWSTQMQLPNLVTSHSAGNLTTEVLALADTRIINTLERLNDIEVPPPSEPRNIPAFFPPVLSLSDKVGAASGGINVFIDADNDDQQSNDAASEAFQSGAYRQQQIGLHSGLQLSNDFSGESKRSVDDLVPLAVVVDTTVFVAYTRQSFTSLLLLALREEKQEAIYRMVGRLVSGEESSARLHRCLRIAVGLDTKDAAFEVGYISESIRSSHSLQLQKAVLVLLKHEAKNFSSDSSTHSLAERSPLLHSFCQEMLGQCDRGLCLVRTKQSGKTVSDSLAIQSAAAWFAWVAGMVIGFVEDQLSGVSSSSVENAVNRCFAYDVPPFSSTAFVEKLVIIASSASTTSKSWKYVAFRLITRILLVVRADTSSEIFASAQLANLTELLTLRCRREMYNRVFFSDVTITLFTLLVRSSASLSRDSKVDSQQRSENQCVNFRVNNYSSTQVTISWDQTSCTNLPSTPTKQSDSVADEATSESRTEINSSIMFLDVLRCGPQRFGCVAQNDSNTNASKVLPLKGTYTIRNLLPDTQYRIRLAPAQPQNDITTCTGASDVSSKNDNTVQGAEVIVQTPPDPVFELDTETMGKNLVVFNRNLTAKNTANKKWHSVRASVAFDEGVHTWQVRLDTCVSKNIFIGVCTADASMENYVGSDAYGYGFLANKAVWHNKAKLHSYGEIFKQGDIIQVTLDCNAKTLAFSRNGEYLGLAASDMSAGTSRSGAGSDGNCKWYPAFSMYNKDDKITLIPPLAASAFSTREGRPQNASTFDLIDAMQDVLAHRNHLAGIDSDTTKLFEKAFEEFEDWRRGEKLYREISHGQVIAIDKSKSATDKYGLATGDSVFTSKGQCTVLGEYRHELWYEVDEGGSSVLFGTSSTQLASWSLSSCREMMESPDEYPVHRHYKSKLEMENITITETDSVVEQQDSPTDTADEEMFSFKTFVEAQVQWIENSTSVAEADAKLITELDSIASSQASSSAILLSFADVSTALLLERIYEVHGISAEHGSNQTIARIGLLLYVNRCLYNVVRIAMTRNIFATSLGFSESPEYFSNQSNSSKQVPPGGNTEYQQVSPVAALLNSPHWTLDDPSAFNWMPTLAARLLFASQKEKLIDEELRTTKTTSRTLDSRKEPNDNEDSGVDSDLPIIKISYPLSRATPFWECNSALLKKKSCFCLPLSTESSVFVQLAKQLAAQDARQWRRESSQPFEAIPISQAFQVHVEKSSTESSGEVGKDEKNGQQEQDEDDEDQLQQPSSKQTARYLNIFEHAVREIQSSCFPLFAPAHGTVGMLEGEPRHPLQLDINVELFSPSALAHSRVQSSQLLLWYFCFGQILGIAWRSKLLLPLQFLSRLCWEELVSPVDPRVNECEDESSRVRGAPIRAIRDGLFSIIPSRCVALLSGSNPSLRDRLSDLDVSYVTRLERHVMYTVPRQSHHELFWMTVNSFTSVERRMLEQFINPERRTGTKQVEMMPGTAKSFPFVLEIADALADGRDHPDSCYPVVVSTGPHSSRLHLPAYTSAQTLRNKLLLAMTNIPFM